MNGIIEKIREEAKVVVEQSKVEIEEVKKEKPCIIISTEIKQTEVGEFCLRLYLIDAIDGLTVNVFTDDAEIRAVKSGIYEAKEGEGYVREATYWLNSFEKAVEKAIQVIKEIKEYRNQVREKKKEITFFTAF